MSRYLSQQNIIWIIYIHIKKKNCCLEDDFLSFFGYIFSFKIFRFSTFSYPCMVEKVLLFGQIFEVEILIDLHVLSSHEFKNHIFSGLCMYVCASFITVTQKQIAAESSNLAFYICIIRRYYLKRFIKIGQKLCVQERIKKF